VPRYLTGPVPRRPFGVSPASRLALSAPFLPFRWSFGPTAEDHRTRRPKEFSYGAWR